MTKKYLTWAVDNVEKEGDAGSVRLGTLAKEMWHDSEEEACVAARELVAEQNLMGVLVIEVDSSGKTVPVFYYGEMLRTVLNDHWKLGSYLDEEIAAACSLALYLAVNCLVPARR